VPAAPPSVIDEVHRDAAAPRRQQHVGELAARRLVELVAFHVDAGLRGPDGFGQGGEAGRAVHQQLDPVAAHERHLREALALLAHEIEGMGRVCTHLGGEKVRAYAGRGRAHAAAEDCGNEAGQEAGC